jgi:hypothetical protein
MQGKREPPAPLAVLFGRLARNHPAARAVGPLRRRPGAECSRAWTWPRSRNRSAAAHGAASHRYRSRPQAGGISEFAFARQQCSGSHGRCHCPAISGRPFFRRSFVHHAASSALPGNAGQIAPRGVARLQARRSFRGQRQPSKLVHGLIHIGDKLVPINPDTIGARLEAAGFEVLEVEKNSHAFRFQARNRQPVCR